jgi:hypothetical protein
VHTPTHGLQSSTKLLAVGGVDQTTESSEHGLQSSTKLLAVDGVDQTTESSDEGRSRQMVWGGMD